MITVNGRLAARILMGAAGAVFVLAGTGAYRGNRYTPAEVVTSVIAFLVALGAALWLHRQNQREDDGDAPMDRPECPYGCDHGDQEGKP